MATVIITGIAYSLSQAWSLPSLVQWLYSHQAEFYDPKRVVLRVVVGYLGASILTVVSSFAIIAERQSRRKAEALTRQVESLAATLERTRIARDIHDSLGHVLTTLDIQLEVAQKLRSRNPDKALQSLDTAKLLASQCLTEVRRALQAMRQTDFDLNTALGTLLEQVNQNQAFTIELKVNLPQLPLQTSHQLYCIMQEGLTNIQKHAGAQKISLRGQPTADGIIIELEDDGVGFDPGLPRSGFGLRGMQERVQILGGQLKLSSTPGQGTQIQVRIPL